MAEDQFLEDVESLSREIVATLSPERRVDYIIAKRHAEEEKRAREYRQAAEAKKVAAQKEQRRVEAEERFGQQIRARFFANNPHASESDFVRLWPRLRDEGMLRGGDASVEAERREIERRTNKRYDI